MKVLIPLEIESCEANCPFWETAYVEKSTKRFCTFNGNWEELLISESIPDWCPLKAFEETK